MQRRSLMLFIILTITAFAQATVLYIINAYKQYEWVETYPRLWAILLTAACCVPTMSYLSAYLIKHASLARNGAALFVLMLFSALVSSPIIAAQTFSDGFGMALAAILCACVIGLPFLQLWLKQSRLSDYGAYTSLLWRNVFAFTLALIFLGLFWVLLQLAAKLFLTVGFNFLDQLIATNLFCLCISSLCLAYSIVLFQSYKPFKDPTSFVVVLKWLLPFTTLIVAVFTVLLLSTGLSPLFKQKVPAYLIIALSVMLIAALHLAYGDGRAVHKEPRWLRFILRFSPIMLPMVAGVSLYALVLRIEQYGLTPERVWGLFIVLMLCAYAFVYGVSMFSSTHWQRRMGQSQLTMFTVIFSGIVLLSSPIFDPVRLTITSQLARLADGRVSAEKFDYGYLLDLGAQGNQALQMLSQTRTFPHFAEINRLSTLALQRHAHRTAKPLPLSIEQKIAAFNKAVRIYPQGRSLPPDFVKWFVSSQNSQNCMKQGSGPCDILIIDLNHDQRDELVSFDHSLGQLYAKTAQDWARVAELRPNDWPCQGKDSEPDLNHARTQRPKWDDIMLNDGRVWHVKPIMICNRAPLRTLRPSP